MSQLEIISKLNELHENLSILRQRLILLNERFTNEKFLLNEKYINKILGNIEHKKSNNSDLVFLIYGDWKYTEKMRLSLSLNDYYSSPTQIELRPHDVTLSLASEDNAYQNFVISYYNDIAKISKSVKKYKNNWLGDYSTTKKKYKDLLNPLNQKYDEIQNNITTLEIEKKDLEILSKIEENYSFLCKLNFTNNAKYQNNSTGRNRTTNVVKKIKIISIGKYITIELYKRSHYQSELSNGDEELVLWTTIRKTRKSMIEILSEKSIKADEKTSRLIKLKTILN
jgi:hypothetical protein